MCSTRFWNNLKSHCQHIGKPNTGKPKQDNQSRLMLPMGPKQDNQNRLMLPMEPKQDNQNRLMLPMLE